MSRTRLTRRSVLLLVFGICLAIVVFDYVTYHSRFKTAICVAQAHGARVGSLLDWPLGRECRSHSTNRSTVTPSGISLFSTRFLLDIRSVLLSITISVMPTSNMPARSCRNATYFESSLFRKLRPTTATVDLPTGSLREGFFELHVLASSASPG